MSAFKTFILSAIVAFAALFPTAAVAQGLRGYKSNPETRLTITKPATPTAKASKGNQQPTAQEPEEPLYALYREVVRRYSWLEGLGEPITDEAAQHLPVYYRLSMKNKAGHWQHIEAMHGDTLTSNHSVDMYGLIAKKADEPTEWELRLAAIAQWLITPSLDGNDVIEERAYDSDGNMIYSFQPVRNSTDKVTCSYNDSWGYPVDFDEKSDNYYGSVICIEYDKNGYDHIIDYLDGFGLRKRNSNDVDQLRIERDDQGRKIRETSHNIVGDYITDRWGNCGNTWEYGVNEVTQTRIDKYLEPMRMPDTVAGPTRTFISCKTAFDAWGRKKTETMLDEKGEPDTTLAGISRIEYSYDDNGNLIDTKYYDKDNNLMETAI